MEKKYLSDTYLFVAIMATITAGLIIPICVFFYEPAETYVYVDVDDMKHSMASLGNRTLDTSFVTAEAKFSYFDWLIGIATVVTIIAVFSWIGYVVTSRKEVIIKTRRGMKEVKLSRIYLNITTGLTIIAAFFLILILLAGGHDFFIGFVVGFGILAIGFWIGYYNELGNEKRDRIYEISGADDTISLDKRREDINCDRCGKITYPSEDVNHRICPNCDDFDLK